ncbi:RHS repeat-associated core domain-containing protein [Aquimarina hainanensis]|uniref:RHS repeat-associated core domain-containing protein n=1 Tax=Aquimarina hainanensis TaxID=1578017 RepID=A0ABW5N9M3_9FLAO
MKKEEITRKLGAYLLSILMMSSSFSPTYAYAKYLMGLTPSNTGFLQVDKEIIDFKGGSSKVDQVDLGTGNVALSASLFSVEGYNAKIRYSSEGVAKKASVWNRDQKQGVIGLGWSYPEHKIIRLTQQTGTLEDDKYLLYVKGNSFPLLFVSEDNEEKTYRIAKQPDWIIKHQKPKKDKEGNEIRSLEESQWRVYHPNGKIYIYGDGNLITHVSNGVEYNVKWSNWIGSSVSTGQSLLPISYNLSAIENVYGEQVKFFYTQQKEQVGSNGLEHTRATYLSKIVGLRGKSIEIKYNKKEAFEYQDPHTENNNISMDNDKDAYQERYENLYLSEVLLKNRKGILQRSIVFGHNFLNKGSELQKRLLTSITYKDAKGHIYQPSKLFNYFGIEKEIDGVYAGLTKNETKLYNAANGALYGAIKQQTLSEGVSYAYHYGKEQIQGSSKDIEIKFPKEPYNSKFKLSSKWSAPELFYGSDYVVAIFESQDLTLRQSYVKVYQWIGDRWIEKDIGQFDGYFYDRYYAKDQYTKGFLKQLKSNVFEAIGNTFPVAAGVLNGFEDALKDTGKTLYKVGDDISHGEIGKAIKDWFEGSFNGLKDIAKDIAAGLEKEVDELILIENQIFGSNETIFLDTQKKLYELRDKDASDNPRKVYHVTLQDHFFALTSSWGGQQVAIVQKNNLVPGEWITNREGVNIMSKFFTFDSGDNFVALLDEVTDFLYIYSWDGQIWSTYSKPLKTSFNARITSNSGKNNVEIALDGLLGPNGEEPEQRLDHRSAINAKNNMIIAVITDSQGINADVNLLYHDENMNWKSKGTQLNKKAALIGDNTHLNTDQLSRFSIFMGRDAKIDVKMGNSFAVLQTYNNEDENIPDVSDIPLVGTLIGSFVPDTKKINSTYGITWDENYDNISLTHLHSAAGQSGVESFIVGDVINKIGKSHSLIVGSNDALAPADGKNYAFRYTGSDFLSYQIESPYYTGSFANDVSTAIVEGANKAYKIPKFYQYDPNIEEWGEIGNASQEQIGTSEFIDSAINVSVEVLNIIVQVVSLAIPGLGEVAEVGETLETINNAANVAGTVSGLMEPVANEIVKDIIGTNHKSTSIANNYISVNGKLFHRQPSGSWLQVTNDEFTLNSNNRLVNRSNSIVDNFIPYTLKTPSGLENHIKLLRNGKVYESKKLSITNKIIHQDSISSTVGPGAYVSYGPANPNGFIQKNEYLEQFRPVIEATAEERSRNKRPAYKEATQVTLHKVTGDSFDTELYDYPVTRVSIQQGNETLGHHYYKYDKAGVAYNSVSKVALYGKVTDIPSSIDYGINEEIPLNNTDGGYTEYYYYNRYNSFGKQAKATGHVANHTLASFSDQDLITYQSSYDGDNVSFNKGGITVLDGHPYASLIYNTDQKVVSQDFTYYKVWEHDLMHQITNGNTLQETKTYTVRPVQKIKVIDGVAYKTNRNYEFNSSGNLVLRDKSIEGTSTDGLQEVHSTRYVYADEHYDSLRNQNRLGKPFITLESIKKGTQQETVTNVDVITYDQFMVRGKNVFAPKHFYKASEAYPINDYMNSADIISKIEADLIGQDRDEIAYEEKITSISKGYFDAHKAIELILRKEDDLKSEIHGLNTEMHVLSRDIEEFKLRIADDKNAVKNLHEEIKGLYTDIDGFNTSIQGEYAKIKEAQDNIDSYNTFLNGFLVGLSLGFKAISDNKKIASLKDDISGYRSAIRQLYQNIQQKRNEISSKRTSVTDLLDQSNELTGKITTIETALNDETALYHDFHEQIETLLVKSHETIKNYRLISLDTDKHTAAVNDVTSLQVKRIHDKYLETLERLNIAIANLPELTSSLNVNLLNSKVLEHKAHLTSLLERHKVAVDYIQGLPEQLQGYGSYQHKWVRTNTIMSRDSETGIPIVVSDTEDNSYSTVLDPNHKKPMVTYKGINIKDINEGGVKYYGFEEGASLLGGQLNQESHTGDYSIKLNGKKGILPGVVLDNNKRNILSAWIKSGQTNIPTFFKVGNTNTKSFSADQEWKYIEAFIEIGASEVQIEGVGDLLIDDLLIRPVSVKTAVTVRDDNGMISASINNNGNTIKHLFDDAQRHFVSLEDQGRAIGYSHHFYGRGLQIDGVYNPDKPNNNLRVGFQGKSVYKGDLPNGISISKSTLNEEYGFGYGISFIAESDFGVSSESLRLERDGPALNIDNIFTGESTQVKIGKRKHFLITKIREVLHVYADGELIKQLNVNGLDSGDIVVTGSVRKLFAGGSPILSMRYLDGLARSIQHQYFYNDYDNKITGKIVSGTIYNGWGNPILQTKPALDNYSEQQYSLSYDSNFANYDGNRLTGNLFSFYKTRKEGTSTYDTSEIKDHYKMFDKTVYSKDALQRVVSVHHTGITDVDLNKTRTFYQDAIGRELETELGISTSNELKFATTTTRKRDNDKSVVHDTFGRLIASKDGNSVSEQTYSYKTNGHKISSRLPLSFQNNDKTKYTNSLETLDLLGDQSLMYSIDEGSSYTVKNKKGLPVFISTEDFSAQGTDISWRYFKYDTQDRPIESGIAIVSGVFNAEKMVLLANLPVWLSDIVTTPVKTWVYDQADQNTIDINTKGRVAEQTSLSNGTSVTTKFTYNPRGQVVEKTTQVNQGDSNLVKYQYYSNGKIKNITYPNGTEVAYTYDLNGRLYGIGSVTDQFIYAKYGYGINGKVIQKNFNNETIANRIQYTLQENQKEQNVTVANKVLFKEKLNYTKNNTDYYKGLVVEKEEINELQQRTEWKYTYDNRYQLTKVDKNQSGVISDHSYTYDVNGNLQEYTNSLDVSQNVNYNYQEGSNKLRSASEEANAIGLYTKIGNTPFSNNTRLTYDKLTRKVISINQQGTQEAISFTYDAYNRRVQKVKTGAEGQKEILSYTWGTRSLPLYESYSNRQADISSPTEWSKVYIYGEEYAPIAMIHNGKTYYFIRDYQSSLRYVIDASDNTTKEKYVYNPYGKIEYSYQEDVNQPLGTYLYTGQEYDHEVGIYNFKARQYDPIRRIFLQPDPKHINYSPYTYANNNPVNFVDRNGKNPLYILDHIEDELPARELSKTGIVVTYEDIFGKTLEELPDLSKVGFDGNVTIMAHGYKGVTSKIGVRTGNARMFIEKQSFTEELGTYLGTAKIDEINLNFGICHSADCSTGTSVLDEFGQSLADQSSKTINAVGFTENVGYTTKAGGLSNVFLSGTNTQKPFGHVRDFNNLSQGNISNNALDRSLNETGHIDITTAEFRQGLGPYGVSKTFKPRNFLERAGAKIGGFFKWY